MNAVVRVMLNPPHVAAVTMVLRWRQAREKARRGGVYVNKQIDF